MFSSISPASLNGNMCISSPSNHSFQSMILSHFIIPGGCALTRVTLPKVPDRQREDRCSSFPGPHVARIWKHPSGQHPLPFSNQSFFVHWGQPSKFFCCSRPGLSPNTPSNSILKSWEENQHTLTTYCVPAAGRGAPPRDLPRLSLMAALQDSNSFKVT